MLQDTSQRFLDKRSARLARKTFRLQEETKDCGSACLASVLQFYGATYTITEVNELSGTNSNGTTVLGLHTAGTTLGLENEALKAKSIANLDEVGHPSILHVVIDNSLYHFVVYYGKLADNQYLIGDPARGVISMSGEDLESIWQSKILINFKVPRALDTNDSVRLRKRKLIMDILRSQQKILFVSIFLGLIVAALSLSSAVFYQYFIDKIIPSKNTQKLMLAFLSLTFLLLCNAGLGYIREIIIYRQSKALNIGIFSTFFENLVHLSKSFFEKKRIGDLTSRLMDIRQIDVFLTQAVGNTIINFLIIVLFTVVIFTKSSAAALVLLIAIPITLVITRYFITEIIPLQKEVLSSYGNTESIFYDIIKGIDTIKSYSKERSYLNVIFPAYNKFQDVSFQSNKTEAAFNFSIGFTMILSSMSIIFLTTTQVMAGELKLGEMLAIIFLSSTVITSANSFIPIIMLFERVNISVSRIVDHMILPTDREAPGLQESISIQKLDIKQLSYGFVGFNKILKEVNLVVNKGETVLIRGDIGSGKSLLFSVLLKLYDDVNGTVSLTDTGGNTHEWQKVPKPDWRKMFGIVPQEITLFNGSILENIVMDRIDGDVAYNRALQIYNVVMRPSLNNVTHGALTLIGQGGVKLSGGQMKLLGLSRALFKNPQVLLIDEITAGMDKTTELNTIELLNSIKENFIILFISHYVPTNLKFEREYVLEQGTLQLPGI